MIESIEERVNWLEKEDKQLKMAITLLIVFGMGILFGWVIWGIS